MTEIPISTDPISIFNAVRLLFGMLHLVPAPMRLFPADDAARERRTYTRNKASE
jgi:hypothetical protein